MGLTNTPTPNTTPDTDNDTPPYTQPIRPFSFTNGTSKNHHQLHHQPPPHAAVVYRECLKNHAANIGGHALDGCGEFMPSRTATPTDPSSLKCAACGCHRNFHRREYEEYSSPFMTTTTTIMSPHFLDFRHTRRSSPSSPSSQPPPPPPASTTFPYASPSPQMLLALSTAAHDDQQVPNHDHHHHHHQQVATSAPATPRHAKAAEINLSGRKRFRTKFSQEQKEKMQSFAENLGWKMQKRDDNMVQNFCNEIGVARGVLKVWMHNNKNSSCRRSDIISTNLNPTKMEEDNNVNDIGNHCNNEIRDSNLDLDCNSIANGGSSSS